MKDRGQLLNIGIANYINKKENRSFEDLNPL